MAWTYNPLAPGRQAGKNRIHVDSGAQPVKHRPHAERASGKVQIHRMAARAALLRKRGVAFNTPFQVSLVAEIEWTLVRSRLP